MASEVHAVAAAAAAVFSAAAAAAAAALVPSTRPVLTWSLTC